MGGPGSSWCLCWRSWVVLGPLLGSMLAVLGLMLAVVGCSGSVCWRSWRLLGPLLAVLSRLALKKVEEHHHLENVLISRVGVRSAAWRAVLSRSWGLCWRSWGALGAYVGGLGPLLGRILPLLGGLGLLLGPMVAVLGVWGPKWSVLRGDQGRKVAQTRAGRPFWGGDRFRLFLDAGPPCRFFSVDICI